MLSALCLQAGRLLKDLLEFDWDGRIREGGIDIINGYGIERIGGVTADIHDDGQSSRLTRCGDLFFCEEGANVRREINAVDEDIDVEDLLEWPTLGCLRQIPLEDVISEATVVGVNHYHPRRTHLLVETNLAKEIDGAAPTSSESTDHEGLDPFSAPSEYLLDVVHHLLFVWIGFEMT